MLTQKSIPEEAKVIGRLVCKGLKDTVGVHPHYSLESRIHHKILAVEASKGCKIGWGYARRST